MNSKIFLTTVILLATTLCAVAQGEDIKTDGPRRKEPTQFGVRLHTGVDLGAAIPWPISAALNGGDKMSAVPHLTPAMGLSANLVFNKHWALIAEGTYKRVAMDIDIRTSRQLFKLSDKEAIFNGQATTKMDFTAIEMPLYVRYTFSRGINRIFLGGYYARTVKGTFVATALDGTLTTTTTGEVESVTRENPLVQDFSSNLDKWDVGMIVGYERRLFNRAYVSGRVSVGFKDVFKPGGNYLEYSMWNMRGSLVLSYLIFSR